MHGDDHSTHIHHPIMGIAYALLFQEGQVAFTASPVVTSLFIHTHPNNSVSSIIHPDFELNILNNLEITLEHLSSDAKLQHAMAMHHLTVTV